MADKYYRLVCFVVNICPEPLREFFLKLAKSDPSVTAVYTDLGAYLTHRQPQIANLKARKIIRQDQYDLIFPSAGSANISEWDVTLLVTLIKNSFVIKPLEEFLLEEMRKIRNDLQHIPNTSAISDGEFDGYWNRLKNAAKTLAREVSGPAYETEIGEKVIDIQCNNLPSLANTLRIFYDEVRKQLFSKIDSMEEKIQSLEGNVIELKAKLDIVATNSAVSTSVLSSVTVTKFGPNGEKVKRIKAVDDILHRLVKQLQSTMQTELKENFTPPTEIAEIEAKLNDTHHVIVAGARNSPYLETALYVIKNRAYNLQRCVEMNDASDWRHIDPDEVDLVFIKDPFGSYCYDDTKARSMLNIFDSIYHAVQPKQGQKTLDVIIVSDIDYLTEVNRFKEHELLNEVVKMFEPTSSSAPVEITTVVPASTTTSSNHFVRQMTDIFLSHFSEDSKRMDKNTVKAAKEKLKKNKMLVITGPAESGKTSLAVELAKSYAKDEVLMFSSADKIETIDFQRTSLVIVDDFVGKYGFQRKKVIEWFLRFDQLYMAVTAGKLNIIVTCETSQIDKCNDEIKSHPLLSNQLVLTKLSKYVKLESSGGPENYEDEEDEEESKEEEEEDEENDEVEEIDEEEDEEGDEEGYEAETDVYEEENEEEDEYVLEDEEKNEEDDEEEDGNCLVPQPPRPYIQSEALHIPFPTDSLFRMIPDQESFSVIILKENALEENASESIRYVSSVMENRLTTTPKACCMLPNSEILLLGINNHLIKLDSTYKEVGLCNLNAWLYDHLTGVCYIGNKTAVVCANLKLIYVDVGRMTVEKTSDTDVESRSIACNNTTLYLLEDYRVYTYTVNGKRLTLLYLFSGLRKSILTHIAVNDDGRRVYITTSDNNIITIDSSGTVLNILSLSSPRCICVDERYVWVCSLFGDVYQVRADGNRILNCLWDHQHTDIQLLCYDWNKASLKAISYDKILSLKFH